MVGEQNINDIEIPPAVADAVRQGRKVVAIKLLREATGLGLANAKVVVDRAAQEYARSNPAAAHIREASNAGRVLGLMLCLVVALIVYRLFGGG